MMTTDTGLFEAICGALGSDAVDNRPETLDKYARSTGGFPTRPAMVCYPTTTEQVQALVRAVQGMDTVLYPISGGCNWGYGDACAPTEGAVIVDLGRMNRILEVDTDLAYCVVEPGVTQGQLYQHLQDNKTGLWMDATAAGLKASIMGNTVDRGFGHTRYADHYLTSCGFEIVLADGRVLQTGFAHYENAHAKHVYRHGVGPALDGLFTQSNYGIVTRIALWLMPEPEDFAFFYFRAPEKDALAPIIDALRPLRLQGTLQTAVHVGNDMRLLAAARRYPWEETGGVTPLPPEIREKLRNDLTAGNWTASGTLAGSTALVREGKRKLRQALKGIGTVRFANDRSMALLRHSARLLGFTQWGKKMNYMLGTLGPNYGMLKGIPTDEPLRGSQWRVRGAQHAAPQDPRDTNAGVLWLAPVMPARGRDAKAVHDIVEPIFLRNGLDPLMTFTTINERSLVAILNAAFDRTVPEEQEGAHRWYEEASTALIEAGYIPYRASPQTMPKLRHEGDVFWDVATAIKRTLDPQDLLSRGRYIPPLEP